MTRVDLGAEFLETGVVTVLPATAGNSFGAKVPQAKAARQDSGDERLSVALLEHAREHYALVTQARWL